MQGVTWFQYPDCLYSAVGFGNAEKDAIREEGQGREQERKELTRDNKEDSNSKRK